MTCQKQPDPVIWTGCSQVVQLLQLYNVLGLRSAVALNHVELYALTFVQRLVAIALDCAEVYEYVIAAFNFDESEALLSIEPLYCSFLHMSMPPSCDLTCSIFYYK